MANWLIVRSKADRTKKFSNGVLSMVGSQAKRRSRFGMRFCLSAVGAMKRARIYRRQKSETAGGIARIFGHGGICLTSKKVERREDSFDAGESPVAFYFGGNCDDRSD